MFRKRLILFIGLICTLLSLISCYVDSSGSNSKNYFDKSAYAANKSLWDIINFEKYSFEYSIKNGGGTLIEAITTVIDGNSETVIKTLYNTPIDEYPEEYKQDAINDIIHSWFYLDSVESIFEFIEKAYKSCVDRVTRDQYIYSVTMSVKYNEYGVPILIDTSWTHKRDIYGLIGPKVVIRFSQNKNLDLS